MILDRSVFGDSVFAEVGYMDENISDEGSEQKSSKFFYCVMEVKSICFSRV